MFLYVDFVESLLSGSWANNCTVHGWCTLFVFTSSRGVSAVSFLLLLGRVNSRACFVTIFVIFALDKSRFHARVFPFVPSGTTAISLHVRSARPFVCSYAHRLYLRYTGRLLDLPIFLCSCVCPKCCLFQLGIKNSFHFILYDSLWQFSKMEALSTRAIVAEPSRLLLLFSSFPIFCRLGVRIILDPSRITKFVRQKLTS